MTHSRNSCSQLARLLQLCRGSGIVFPERPKPAGKPPELQRRLDELRARLEQQQYDRMVADVTQVGAAAECCRWVLQHALWTLRQLCFGLKLPIKRQWCSQGQLGAAPDERVCAGS